MMGEKGANVPHFVAMDAPLLELPTMDALTSRIAPRCRGFDFLQKAFAIGLLFALAMLPTASRAVASSPGGH